MRYIFSSQEIKRCVLSELLIIVVSMQVKVDTTASFQHRNKSCLSFAEIECSLQTVVYHSARFPRKSIFSERKVFGSISKNVLFKLCLATQNDVKLQPLTISPISEQISFPFSYHLLTQQQSSSLFLASRSDKSSRN